MAADTFTITPEMLGDFQMFRFEGFEGDVSVFYSLHDTYGEALEEGRSNVATQINITPQDEVWTAEYIDQKNAEEYLAVCGSWDCRAPECRPAYV